jgi:hypothetical protein
MLFDVPVIDEVTVSVPVMVCPPGVTNVADSVFVPSVRVVLIGRIAEPMP